MSGCLGCFAAHASSNHTMVVSCGWAKFMRIEKKKKLQLDVAGSMYQTSISRTRHT